MDNGTETKAPSSLLADLLDVLTDHADLAAAELGYEAGFAGRFAIGVAAGLLLVIMAFVLLQAALVFGLARAGLPIWVSCVVLAGVYLAGAAGAVFALCRRDPKAGAPFEGTRRELRETVQWIRKILS